jgi:hypothetical protein
MIDDDDKQPITLSREDLYELAWSKPLSELAKDFGISDVALGKRCKRLGIPVPGRGYWARVDAGQRLYRPRLPKREAQWHDQHALAVASSQNAPSDVDRVREDHDEASPLGPQSIGVERAKGKADAEWLAEHVAFEDLADHRINLPVGAIKWDSGIRAIRDDLQKAATEMRASRKASDRYDKWPESRKRAETCNESWKWRWSVDRGQRLWETHKSVAFRVSLETYERALAITNALALAARARGFSIRDDRELGRVVFVGHNAEIQMRIAEQLERKDRQRVRYDGKKEQENYLMPTGRLRISLQTGYREGPTFEDKETKKLESALNAVFVAMYRLVIKCWEQERGRQDFQQQLKETERQRAEMERIRAEQERQAAEERRRREQLLQEASNWNTAGHIRAYVAHLQAAVGAVQERVAVTNWLEWALRIASEIDPTAARLSNAKDPEE